MFGCVHTHTHTKETVFTAVSVLHVEMTGGLSCSNSTNIELYINFTIEFSQLMVYRHCLTNQAIKAMKLYNMV